MEHETQQLCGCFYSLRTWIILSCPLNKHTSKHTVLSSACELYLRWVCNVRENNTVHTWGSSYPAGALTILQCSSF